MLPMLDTITTFCSMCIYMAGKGLVSHGSQKLSGESRSSEEEGGDREMV